LSLYHSSLLHDSSNTELYTLSLHDALPILKPMSNLPCPIPSTLAVEPPSTIAVLESGKTSSISSSIAPDKVYQTPPTVAAPKVISDATSVGLSFPFALLLSLSFSESQAAMISNNSAAKVICNFLITLPPNIVGDPTKNKFVFLSSLIKRFIFVSKLCSC